MSKAKGKGTITVIAVIAVVALLIFSGSKLTSFLNNPVVSGKTGGTLGVQFTVTYLDGSTQTFPQTSSLTGLNLLPLTITYNGQPISSIKVAVIGLVSGATSTIGAWSTTTAQTIEVYGPSASTPSVSSTASYPDSGTGWTSGTTNTLASYTLPANQLDPVLQGINPTTTPINYNIYVTATSTLNAVVNGAQQTYTSTAHGTCTITYVYSTSAATPQISFSISVDTSPFISGTSNGIN